MKKLFQQVSVLGLMLALPALVFGAADIESVFAIFLDIINIYIIPLIVALAVVFFLWGVMQYVTAAGDEEKKKSGRDHMIYGIIALFVMVSVWGLVNLLSGTFDLNTRRPPVPTVEI